MELTQSDKWSYHYDLQETEDKIKQLEEIKNSADYLASSDRADYTLEVGFTLIYWDRQYLKNIFLRLEESIPIRPINIQYVNVYFVIYG